MESFRFFEHLATTGHPLHVNLSGDSITGGTLTKEAIDTLQKHPGAITLRVSGLRDDTLEYLMVKYGHQFRAVEFWKCPRVEDLSPIENAVNMTHALFYWNQKATRFWDFRKTASLAALKFDNFTRMDDLSALAGSQLRMLEFGNGFSGNCGIKSLDPIGELVSLEDLCFNPRQIADQRIEPLARLPRLKALRFSSNIFSTQQVAWLKTKVPAEVAATLDAYWTYDPGPLSGNKPLRAVVMGKRKPTLDTVLDAVKLAAYQAQFCEMVDFFMANPEATPAMYAPGKRPKRRAAA